MRHLIHKFITLLVALLLLTAMIPPSVVAEIQEVKIPRIEALWGVEI
jgi:hypothetical protein